MDFHTFEIIVWVLLAALAIGALLFFLRKLILIQRYCEKCGEITPHIVQYGYGRRFSYFMTFMTLGWRTMMMQYYPLECLNCGNTFKTPKKETDLDIKKPKRWYDASDWNAFGGPKNWNQLRLSQRIFMILMISMGVFITIMYLFGRPIIALIEGLIN